MQRPDIVELVIGYHLLEGKMVDLKKPFAILEKQTAAFCSSGDYMDEDDAHSSVEYKVHAHPGCGGSLSWPWLAGAPLSRRLLIAGDWRHQEEVHVQEPAAGHHLKARAAAGPEAEVAPRGGPTMARVL